MQAALFKETKFHLASQTRSHDIVLSDLWLRTDILFSSLIWFKVASFQGSGSRGVTVKMPHCYMETKQLYKKTLSSLNHCP